MEPNKQVDHRWSTRQQMTLPVKLFDEGEPVAHGRTHDIGIGGMYVELSGIKHEALCADKKLAVAFTVANKGNVTHHRLPATVIWSAEKGAGLMFTDFNVETVHALREILYPQ